jgi:hypothetical protein
MPSSSPRRPSRTLLILPLSVAALSAVLAGQMIARDPRFALPLAALAVLMFVPAVLGRWRMRRLLMSGDVERIIGTWAASIDRVAHGDTMAPLLQATAYASYGWVEAARRALGRAAKGPAWEAAFEQRLFVETLLDTFEGDREAAVRKAEVLEALPLPSAGPLARRRISVLRRGLAAMARAFAHASREGDPRVLSRAATASPLVHWAMRYAGAIVAVDRGHGGQVQALLAGAPDWPAQSAFHEYHQELLSRTDAKLA